MPTLIKKLAQEEVWIRQGIKARRTRNEGRVRALKQLREERQARREQVGNVNISMNAGEQSGKLVCKVKNLHLEYDGDVLVDNFYTTIMRGDKIGIIGDNGVGKTTLIKAIFADVIDHSDDSITKSGSVTLGTNLQIAFFDQLRDQLDLEASVAQNVSEGSDHIEVNGKKTHIMSYLQDFLFAPERARTPVKALSGGERNRVLLAKQLLKPANVLVLDEPTNDLDMATLELLEESVANFNGTIYSSAMTVRLWTMSSQVRGCSIRTTPVMAWCMNMWAVMPIMWCNETDSMLKTGQSTRRRIKNKLKPLSLRS